MFLSQAKFTCPFSAILYAQCLLEVVHQVKGNKVCFVTLNKPADTLEHEFLVNNVTPKHIFFIDTVSRGIGKARERENVLYVSSPGSFTELSLAIAEVVRTGAFDCIIFDSISTLSIFDTHGNAAERFVSSTIQKTKSLGKMGVFTCLASDMNSQIVQRSCMYVDKVVNISSFRQSIEEKKLHRLMIVGSFAGLALLGFVSSFVSVVQMPSGFVVASGDMSASWQEMLAVGAALAALVVGMFGYFIHHHSQLQPVVDMKLKRIEPERVHAQDLRKSFRAKIKRWVEKHSYLF